MKKILTLIFCAITILSCTPTKESYKFLDEERKSFFVNGISAMDGYSAVIQSLEEIGFKIGEINEVDLSIFNRGVSYYTVLASTRPFTKSEFDKLTNGLFVDLPSGNAILDEVNTNGCKVYLSWYKSGLVNKATIQVSRSSIEEDAIEINKRLATLFPHSKVGNKSWGYMTYYTDYGVEVYYTNDYFISIEKK